MHALDLIQLTVELLHGLVSPQVVHDSPKSLETVHVHAHSTDLAGLRPKAFTDEGGRDQLGHRHRRLVPVQPDCRGRLGHRGLHPIRARPSGEHELAEAKNDC